ncbi:hypothetical protein MLD38_037957 [Melastoma candidum]|uniref:Uncharacterized protein n=1 Tax=Melastoma candidum TaxID=119954 RepID=A0ACB9KYE4_9MYRT|nr:hypothetical protein MLD38_037957 [Melastoma candidum]
MSSGRFIVSGSGNPNSTGLPHQMGQYPTSQHQTDFPFAGLASSPRPNSTAAKVYESNNFPIVCQICNRPGHIAPFCQLNQISSAQAHLTHGSTPLLHDSDRYMDSGATHHVTSDPSNLTIRDDTPNSDHLLVGDGNSLQILAFGSSTLNFSARPLHLKHILYSPKVSKNFISISKFAEDNSCFFELPSNCFIVKDRFTHRELLRGPVKDGLYHFNSSSRRTPQAHISMSNSSVFWH